MDTNQNQPPVKQSPHPWIWLMTIGFLVVVGFGAFWYMMHFMDDRGGSRSVSTSFQIVPASVTANQTFQLVGTFHNIFDSGFATDNNRVTILDSQGKNLLVSRSTIFLPATGRGDQEINPALAGFVFGDTPEPIHQPSSGPTLFSIDNLGCMVGLSGPTGRPPKEYVDRQTIAVLPATPAGMYTVVIEPGAYCNGLPTTTQRLTLTVKE